MTWKQASDIMNNILSTFLSHLQEDLIVFSKFTFHPLIEFFVKKYRR